MNNVQYVQLELITLSNLIILISSLAWAVTTS
jgi:hypothetical protein